MPLTLYGEGHYVLTAIKSIRVTEDFTGLGERTTNCQTGEFRADCLTRNYGAKLMDTCHCVPFSLRSYYPEKVLDTAHVMIKLNISDENLPL